MNSTVSPYQLHKVMRRLRQRAIGNAVVEVVEEPLKRCARVVRGLFAADQAHAPQSQR